MSFLTRDAGKKRGVARGARGTRSPFSGALEPMTEARIVYFEKEGRSSSRSTPRTSCGPRFRCRRTSTGRSCFRAMAESLADVRLRVGSGGALLPPRAARDRRALRRRAGGLVAAYFDVWILQAVGTLSQSRPSAPGAAEGSIAAGAAAVRRGASGVRSPRVPARRGGASLGGGARDPAAHSLGPARSGRASARSDRRSPRLPAGRGDIFSGTSSSRRGCSRTSGAKKPLR